MTSSAEARACEAFHPSHLRGRPLLVGAGPEPARELKPVVEVPHPHHMVVFRQYVPAPSACRLRLCRRGRCLRAAAVAPAAACRRGPGQAGAAGRGGAEAAHDAAEVLVAPGGLPARAGMLKLVGANLEGVWPTLANFGGGLV